MKIVKEITPFDWLSENSWECGDLAQAISDANKETAFNAFVEDAFSTAPTETELNDFCRFNQNEILEHLGIEEENKEEE